MWPRPGVDVTRTRIWQVCHPALESAPLGLKLKLGWIERFIPDWVKRAIDADLNSKTSGLTIQKEWTLVDGFAKFDVIKTSFPLY